MKIKFITVILALLISTSALAQDSSPSATTAPAAAPVAVSVQDPGRLVVPLSKNWSLRPAVNLSLMHYNLRSNDLSAGIVPGIGYGVEYKKIFGADLFAQFEVEREDLPNAIGLSIVLNLLRYASAGIMMEFIDGKEPQFSLLFGGSLPLTLK